MHDSKKREGEILRNSHSVTFFFCEMLFFTIFYNERLVSLKGSGHLVALMPQVA